MHLVYLIYLVQQQLLSLEWPFIQDSLGELMSKNTFTHLYLSLWFSTRSLFI